MEHCDMFLRRFPRRGLRAPLWWSGFRPNSERCSDVARFRGIGSLDCGFAGVPFAWSNGALETPTVGRSYEVWELHKWHVAARLGPQVRGDATDYIQRLEQTPPTVRRSSFREALNVLRSPFQICVPATMHTGASLGSSRMGYQSSQIALAICGGKTNIPLRMRAPLREAPRRHGAGRLSAEKSVLFRVARVLRTLLPR